MPSITASSLRSLNLVAMVGLAAVLAQSCSDEGTVSQSATPDGSVDAGGTGAGPGDPDSSIGGAAGTGAAAGVGGSGPGEGGMRDAGPIRETVEPCPGTSLLDVGALAFAACPLCADAVCVPNALLTNFGGGEALLGDCDATSKCVPRSYVETTGSFRFKTCTAFGAAEGRCVNRCIPAVADQIGLEQGVCGESELCAPCYMPTDGSPTGACGLGCDPGPVDPPFLFESCCGQEGVCVPSDIVPVAQRAALDANTCTAPDTLCAPSAFVTPGYLPPTCDSVAGLEGRCIPACIGMVAESASLLPQAGCADGSLCAPCYDPRTGDPTGACSLNGDAPVDPPGTFPRCCGGDGICVPTTAVPQEVVGALGPDSCTGVDEVCAPEAFADPTYIAPTCDSIGGAEGRCVADCIPQLQRFGTYLPQDDCALGTKCAPCFDPLTGLSTGACAINGDQPANPTPYVFESCCGGGGRCVPQALVPASQQGSLSADTCGVGELCAPTDFIDSTFTPATCTSLLGAEGRCIPSCVGGVAAMAQYLPQDTCGTGELCAPCYNPGDGAATGACSINGDAPVSTTPVLFDNCCNGGGKCVPRSLVPANQIGALAPDTCGAGDAGSSSGPQICAPNFAIVPSVSDCTFPGGTTIPRGPGACFDGCTIPVIAPLLTQEECANGLLCAPCFDENLNPSGFCDPSTPPPVITDN